jgi:hypothetical protein
MIWEYESSYSGWQSLAEITTHKTLFCNKSHCLNKIFIKNIKIKIVTFLRNVSNNYRSIMIKFMLCCVGIQ